MTVDEATAAQHAAAAPGRSVWLAANAGSGKTKVLIDRVARLLVNGAQPEQILCLTFTNAAASEMQNRLLSRLGGWAMLGDDDLRAELRALGEDGWQTPDDLARTRTLFASAIEVPGGLRIQTIHAFCSSILRRFPLEAQVSPQFSQLDDQALTRLCREVLELMARERAGSTLLREIGRRQFDFRNDFAGQGGLAAETMRRRQLFPAEVDEASLFVAHGLPEGVDEAAIANLAFKGDEARIAEGATPWLKTRKVNDIKLADVLTSLKSFDLGELPLLGKAFLRVKDGTARSSTLPTKKTREAMPPDLLSDLHDWMARVEDAVNMSHCYEIAQASIALHRFASSFLGQVKEYKRQQGKLDYDDLVERTLWLLSQPGVADWVLYRLDGSIRHILVDEAQDTSPVQWQIIERLVQEMIPAGSENAGLAKAPSLFVVGDRKQSIFSFQGAEPQALEATHGRLRHMLEHGPTPIEHMSLEYSFRSSQVILDLVDASFRDCAGVGFHKEMQHRAFRDMPGRVDLWPEIRSESPEQDHEWANPQNRTASVSPQWLLSRRVAREIKHWINTPAMIPEGKGWRPVTPGDILILVRGRQREFNSIIRACKNEGLSIAGADRIRILGEMAVKDLRSLLSFIDLPQNDLALAEVLKSPIFGLTEQDLFTLAHGRRGSLWGALAESPSCNDTRTILLDLLEHSDYLRPFELIERVLTHHRGRERLVARLGAEAEEGIDACLDQALAYERAQIPSLTGFLAWLETNDLDIKRHQPGTSGQIRVMTVHGAKGLESPIVVLPDTKSRRHRNDGPILTDGAEVMLRPGKGKLSRPVSRTLAAEENLQRAENERLLYVAMTRARYWLVVASSGSSDDKPAEEGERGSWRGTIEAALTRMGAKKVEHEFADGTTGEVLSLQIGWEPGKEGSLAGGGAEDAGVAHRPEAVPAWLRQVAAPQPSNRSVINPSTLVADGEHQAGDEGMHESWRGIPAAEAGRFGTALHLFLELLADCPAQDRDEIAGSLIRRLEREGMQASLATAARDEATRLLAAPQLADIWAPALTEVELSSPLTIAGMPRRLRGTIDRLLVNDGRVLAVDFKSHSRVPERPENCPESILCQLGGYRAALRQMYPDHRVETAILWTVAARRMDVPAHLVDAALGRLVGG